MQFTQHTVQCIGPSGLHRMAYTEWGDAKKEAREAAGVKVGKTPTETANLAREILKSLG